MIRFKQFLRTLEKLLLALLALTVLTACGESREASPYTEINTLDGLWIEVRADTVSPTGLTVIIHNDTDMDLIYGAWFRVEELSAGQWYSVEPITAWGQNDWGVILCPQGRAEQDYNWNWYYGALKSSSYRIVMELSPWDPWEYIDESYYVSAEFSIESR